MLFSLLRYGTSKCLTQGAICNGFSTTAYPYTKGHLVRRPIARQWRPPMFQEGVEEDVEDGEREQVTRSGHNEEEPQETPEKLNNKIEDLPQNNVAQSLEPLGPYRGIRRLRLDKAELRECLPEASINSETSKGARRRKCARPTEIDKPEPRESLRGGSTSADISFLDGLSKDHEARRTSKTLDGSSGLPTKMTQLRETMALQNPTALLRFVWEASEDLEFMEAIPGVTFIEILRQLHPQDDFSPLRPEYKGQGPKHLKMLSPWRERYYAALRERRRFYRNISQSRIESGRDLGLGEYTQLLNLARATWDGPTALNVMKDIIANDVQPNLTCYNHYFEARCWSDTNIPHERHRLRVMPYNAEMRVNGPRRKVSQDILIDGHRVEEDGIRWEITRMFTKMINDGINADTKAYSNLIIAQSREGDLRAIKSVLHRVWHVDVDALLAGQADQYDDRMPREDSPTYPNEDFLYVLAHVFGSNNDIPAAIRIVDHFSRKYNIRIPQLVWGELLEWTYTLSYKRRKLRKTDGAQMGQLPPKSVESLWNVMLGEPYRSEPNLLMYDLVIRQYWRRQMLSSFLDRMREGVKIHEQHFDEYAKYGEDLFRRTKEGEVYSAEELDSQTIRAEELRNTRWLSFVVVRKWFELLLWQSRWLNEEARVTVWQRKMLPDAVQEFWRYKARKPVKYPIATGWVELDEIGDWGLYSSRQRQHAEEADLSVFLGEPNAAARDEIHDDEDQFEENSLGKKD